MSVPPHSPEAVLAHLRRRGARRLRRVVFRRNRSTLWSLTGRGTTLNLHVAYREAPEPIMDALAVLARTGGGRKGGRRNEAAERARRMVRSWPGIVQGIRRIRREDAGLEDGSPGPRTPVACAGTAAQQAWLREAYRTLNRRRFGNRLPDELPLRFSRRMRASMGHMKAGRDAEGRPICLEIALNLDLLLPGNESDLEDTLLHEMAHAAEWLFDGTRGHGPAWRRWAARAGCRVRTRHDGTFARRRRRTDPVVRVPPPLAPGGSAPP